MILSQKVGVLSQVTLGQRNLLKIQGKIGNTLNVVPILNGTSNINYLGTHRESPSFYIGKETNLIYREPGTNGVPEWLQ